MTLEEPFKRFLDVKEDDHGLKMCFFVCFLCLYFLQSTAAETTAAEKRPSTSSFILRWKNTHHLKNKSSDKQEKGYRFNAFFSTTAETEKMDILLKGVFSCLLHDPSDSCIPFYNSMSCMTKMHFSAREAQGNKTGLYGVLFSCIFFKHLILSSHPFVEKRSHAWLMFPQKLFSSSLGLHSSSSLWRRCWWSCLWISSFRSSKLLFPSSSWHHIWLSFKYHCQYNIDMKGRGGL